MYNWSSVLRYAIRTVLWQTYSRFELLVVGDGCTDDSGDVVAAFGAPRVRWHNLPRNPGHQSVPNNIGLQMARCEYVAYLGHDDVWFPTHLSVLVKALERTQADLAYTRSVMLGPPGSR
jgi:glycosyltransferase involved in cell wall biosynthesis